MDVEIMLFQREINQFPGFVDYLLPAPQGEADRVLRGIEAADWNLRNHLTVLINLLIADPKFVLILHGIY